MSEYIHSPFVSIIEQVKLGIDQSFSILSRKKNAKKTAEFLLDTIAEYALTEPQEGEQFVNELLQHMPLGQWKIRDFENLQPLLVSWFEDRFLLKFLQGMPEFTTEAEKSRFAKKLLITFFSVPIREMTSMRKQIEIAAVNESDVMNVQLGRELAYSLEASTELLEQMINALSKKRNFTETQFRSEMEYLLAATMLLQLRMSDVVMSFGEESREDTHRKINLLSKERMRYVNHI